MKPKPQPFATVPKLFDGGTVLVLGCGPSLTRADVQFARAHVDGCIAVNDSYAMIPDATALYAADDKWWKWHHGAHAHELNRTKYPAFTGRYKYCLRPTGYPDVSVLQKGPETGLSDDPQRVALGRNGVYQAINVAVHFGASRILLLGVDMQDGIRHFFGRHPDNSGPPVDICKQRFATMVKPLRQLGIEVINCTRKTGLTCFPCMPLEDAVRTAAKIPA